MKNFIIVSLLMLSFTTFAKDKKGVKVKVPLTAGSFQLECSKLKGKLVKSGKGYKADKLYVKVKDLKSGMDLRNEHTHKRLISGKHNKIIVTKVMAAGGKGKAILSIKGIKKPINFSYKVQGKLMKATFKVNLKHYKIEDISYAGLGVEDIVTVQAFVPIKG